jgi:hypothetical protein
MKHKRRTTILLAIALLLFAAIRATPSSGGNNLEFTALEGSVITGYENYLPFIMKSYSGL